MLCPSCNGEGFSERSSFKTSSEPLMGAASTTVTVDLMNCDRCGADLPAVRGRRLYALVADEKFSAMLADLEATRRTNLELQGRLDALARRSRSLSAEIERCRAEGENLVLEERIAALENQTDHMEARRARLAETLDLMESRIPVPQ